MNQPVEPESQSRCYRDGLLKAVDICNKFPNATASEIAALVLYEAVGVQTIQLQKKEGV